jgi:hypothetical protein
VGYFTDKKTIVGSNAFHIMDAGGSSDILNDTILSNIITSYVPYASRKSLADYIIKSKLSGFTLSKIKRMQDYARTNYLLGLPQGSVSTNYPLNPEDLASYIITDTGFTDGVIVTHCEYATYNPILAAQDYLTTNRGYDRFTNQISILPESFDFLSPWLEDLTTSPYKTIVGGVTVNAGNTEATIWYDLVVHQNVLLNPGYDREEVPILELQWITYENKASEVINISPTTEWDYECLYASYYKLDATGTIIPTLLPWVYRISDDTYPALNPAVQNVTEEYLPVVPLRHNNIDLTDPAEQNTPPDPSNLYSTSKTLLNIIGIDLGALGTALNENPDVADMDMAYVMWGVDLQTEFAPAIMYLTDYFYNKYQLNPGTEAEYLAAVADENIITPRNGVNWNRAATPENSFEEYGLIMGFEYDYIRHSLDITTLGDGTIGNAEKRFERYEVTIIKSRTYPEGEVRVQTFIEQRYILVLKVQVSDTQVRTIRVYNPAVYNWVSRDYKTTTTIADIINNPNIHTMVIPLEYNLAETYLPEFKKILYMDSALVMINSIEVIKLKWYQSRFFKFVMIVVMIVVTFYSMGTMSAALAAAVEAGGNAVLMLVAQTILIALAIDVAMDWIIEEFGDKLGVIGAVILAVVATVIGGMSGFNPNSMMMKTAGYMMQISSALVSSANEFLAEAGAKITGEYDSFVEKMDGLWEELEETEDLIAMRANYNPLDFTNPIQFNAVLNEKPTTFFARCLGMQDNTMFTIHSEIYNFFDSKLKLDTTFS